jgi:hypothetical protein
VSLPWPRPDLSVWVLLPKCVFALTETWPISTSAPAKMCLCRDRDLTRQYECSCQNVSLPWPRPDPSVWVLLPKCVFAVPLPWPRLDRVLSHRVNRPCYEAAHWLWSDLYSIFNPHRVDMSDSCQLLQQRIAVNRQAWMLRDETSFGHCHGLGNYTSVLAMCHFLGYFRKSKAYYPICFQKY